MILREKNKTGSVTLPNFKLYYKATVIRSSMVLAQKQTRASSKPSRALSRKPTLMRPVNLCQRGKNIKRGKDSILNRCHWEYCTATCKRMNLDYFLTTYTKNKCKMDKRLKCKTVNLKTVRKHWHYYVL